MDPQCYRVGDVEIDPGRGYIRRAGEDVYLRAQSFDLLVYLLTHRDRVVGKEELLQEIWQGLAVGDDAIVQCVADIRRALGDDSRSPRFIRTIPKVGYRFVAAADSAASPSPSTIAIGLGRRSVASTLLLAAAAGIIFVTVNAWRTQTGVGARGGTTRIMVADFENTSGDSELAWLQHGLADMVITDLARFAGVSVMSRHERDTLLRRAGASPDRANSIDHTLDAARQAGASLVVFGSFASSGGAVRLETRVHEVAGGALLGADPAMAETPAQLFTQVDVLALKLARRIGLPDPARATGTLAQAMTDNLEAYRYYALGLARSEELRTGEAIALFEQAIAADPDFAMAYARIGYTYAVRHALLDQAKPYLQRAFAHSARLTERDRLQIAAWYAIANQDYDEAIAQCRQILERYPEDTEIAERLTVLLQGESRLDEARDVALRAYAVDARNPAIVNALGGTYSLLGRHADAVAMFQQYVALAPADANAYDSLGLAYQWAGRYQEAIDAYEKALALNADFEVPIVHLGNVLFQLGRYADAIRTYERYIAAADYDQERSRGHASIARVHLDRGDLAAAERALKRVTDPSQAWFMRFLLDAERGDAAGAAAALRTATRGVGRGAGTTRRWEEYMQGRYALLSGQPEAALKRFREALRHPPPTFSMDAFEDALGHALLHLGRADEAIAEYSRVLALNPNHAAARLGLAQALDKRGERARARAEYAMFVHVWRDADADAPALITARRRLAELQSKRGAITD